MDTKNKKWFFQKISLQLNDKTYKIKHGENLNIEFNRPEIGIFFEISIARDEKHNEKYMIYW
jgi:hypothetical protein